MRFCPTSNTFYGHTYIHFMVGGQVWRLGRQIALLVFELSRFCVFSVMAPSSSMTDSGLSSFLFFFFCASQISLVFRLLLGGAECSQVVCRLSMLCCSTAVLQVCTFRIFSVCATVSPAGFYVLNSTQFKVCDTFCWHLSSVVLL